MNSIIVNGERYSVSGDNVNIVGRRIIVNGQEVCTVETKEVHVIWEGPLATLDCVSATIKGNVEGDVDATNVTCQDIGGNVDATNVTCKGNIRGKVDAVNIR